ncbi:merozoite surface protein 7 (MSP7), putative [Plasmodium ovale wallikeri]|uniref:Merozoite surface protein 7 (MSP7), putative n=1 Tax=Plasmodium ovale wallikeri TaxID=864142 RepID=A0A1A8ZB18_PLAOA|nr:merozoite surface protein 7 (MSP7), putative [Plasmodium ovale wallikeri]
MVKKVTLFSPFLFLLLLHQAASKRKITTVGQGGNYNENVFNMLSQKLGNVYNAGPNSANEAVDKKYKLIKKEMEELQKHEKENAEDDFEQNFMTETDETSGKKKTIFGVDEDDLDSYDEEFFGQGKKIIKGDETGSEKGAKDRDQTDSTGDSTPAQVKAAAAKTSEEGGVSHEGHVVNNQVERSSPDSTSTDLIKSPNSIVGPDKPNGLEILVNPVPHVNPEPNSPSEEKADVDPVVPLQSEGKVPTSVDPDREKAVPPKAKALAQPAEGAPVVSNNSAMGQQTTAKGTSKVTVPEVKYLKNLYDDILGESNQDSAVNALKRHSNYNDIKKEHALPMSSKEYTMVKKLFGDCFKKGSDDNANATPVINVFAKVLDDKGFREEFENVVNGIYGFAKRNSYLNEERWTGENANNVFFKNVVSMLNTL